MYTGKFPFPLNIKYSVLDTSSIIELHVSGIDLLVLDQEQQPCVWKTFIVIRALITNFHFLQQKIPGYEWRWPILEDL